MLSAESRGADSSGTCHVVIFRATCGVGFRRDMSSMSLVLQPRYWASSVSMAARKLGRPLPLSVVLSGLSESLSGWSALWTKCSPIFLLTCLVQEADESHRVTFSFRGRSRLERSLISSGAPWAQLTFILSWRHARRRDRSRFNCRRPVPRRKMAVV